MDTCLHSVFDGFPSFIFPLLRYPLLTWSCLGLLDISTLVLGYLTLTQPMPRWCGPLFWLALPLMIAATTVFMLFFARSLIRFH